MGIRCAMPREHVSWSLNPIKTVIKDHLTVRNVFPLLYCPVVLSHFSPASVKTDRAVRIQQTNQVKVNLSSINQSINRKVYNESLRLIDWFNPWSEKLPHGDDFRVGPKSDRTPRDNTLLLHNVLGLYLLRKKVFKDFTIKKKYNLLMKSVKL